MKGRDIAAAIEAVAPLHLQEEYDNSGWQLGDPGRETDSALICVDVTPEVVDEAAGLGCGLIVSHHPLLFHGLKRITGDDMVQRTVIRALRAGIAVYAAHTSLDNAPAPWGVSARVAALLGLRDVAPLCPDPRHPGAGGGAIGTLPEPMYPSDLARMAADRFGTAAPRMSRPADAGRRVSRVALCGGSGSSMIPQALAQGADAFISADITYHTMLLHRDSIVLVDCGHRETEDCTKSLLRDIISEKFPNFAVRLATADSNPVIAVR